MRTPVGYLRWLVGYDGIDKMARPTFRYDFLSTLFSSLGMGVIMPSLTTQFASANMSTSIWIVGLLFAQRSMGNLVATFFAQDLARRRRVPMVVMARIGIAMFMVCIAVLPTGQPGIAGSFAALLVTPYLLAALCTNLQSVARHSNYPVKARGRIFSRLTVIQLGSLGVSVWLAGMALDWLAWGHMLAYLLSAGCMLGSAWYYSKIRIRRERKMLRDGHARSTNLLAGFDILRQDRTFAQYILWQMVFGGANMMTHPALTKVMEQFTTHYQEQGFGYRWSMGARSTVPLLVAVLVAPLAGKLFDRVRITRYRGIGASMWGLSKLLIFGAVLALWWCPTDGWLFWAPWVMIFVAFAVQGMGQGVGNLAYNLGHMSFTSPERGHDYMGIHLTFQGIRGVAAPMIGAGLFTLIGMSVLPLAAALIFVGMAGFFLMKPPASPEAMAARASQDAFGGAGGRI